MFCTSIGRRRFRKDVVERSFVRSPVWPDWLIAPRRSGGRSRATVETMPALGWLLDRSRGQAVGDRLRLLFGKGFDADAQ